jgi:transposase InsO family protein
MNRASTVVLRVGTRLVHDGDPYTVDGLDAEGVVLRGRGGRRLRLGTAGLLADPGTRLISDPAGPSDVAAPVGPGGLVEAAGPVLDDLTGPQLREWTDRLGHVREVLTGYRSGYAELATTGEPRPAYEPCLPVADRQRAKAAELGVTERTVRRWVRALRESGPVGLVDGRSTRQSDVLGGVDPRWLAACRLVLAEHVEASRPTKQLVLARVAARVEAEHGPGLVAAPGVKKARAVLAELARGSNAFTGSAKGKRSIAGRPQGVYGRLRAERPGEFVLLDSTPLDVFAMEPLTLRWVRVELTVAMDLYSRSILGLRLAAVSTKAVDAAVVLFETLRSDSVGGTGSGLLPYAGLPDVLVVDADHAQVGGLPGVAAETVVVDHGRIYLSEHLLAVCERLGISVAPARPLTPTDKAAVERFFRTLREGLLAALPGYKGPDIHSRGADPEGCAYFFVDELEQVIREWVAGIYHQRPHAGLVEPQVPGLDLCPAEMFAAGVARAGRLRIPAHPGLVFDFLPTAWRTVQHYGVELHGLRYNGPALTAYRNRTSPFTGVHAGKWPVRYDPDDICAVYFQDPADHSWHRLAWEHAREIGAPFSAETLAYARRLALAQGRHVDERRALAQLLDRFDAGLVRSPVERRMAVRASQQRQARLAAAGTESGPAAEVVALPTAAAVLHTGPTVQSGLAATPPDTARSWPGGDSDPADDSGDDDAADDLDADADGRSEEQFYADAFGVLR